MNKQSREELKRKIDAIRIPHEWWTESISQAIPVVLYRAGDNEWPVLVTQEIPNHITPDDCDKFTFGNEQRARVAEFAGAANPAAIQSLLAYVDRLEAQRDRLLDAMRRIFGTLPAQQDGGGFVVDHRDSDGEYIGSQNIDPMWVVQEMVSVAHKAITEAESQS